MKTDPDDRLHRHDYPDREALAIALAAGIAAKLAGAIAERGEASLAVSGGSTPKRLFAVLSETDISWDRVTVILVDERICPPDSDRANQKLVRETLLQGNAAKAHFVAYETAAELPIANAEKSEALFAGLPWPLDVAVLGMGTDGHTASFFPGGDRLSDALDTAGETRVLPMQADGAGEPRLTLTLPALLDARFLALHIEGEEKRGVFDTALAGTDANAMPVRAVLHQDKTPVHVFWAP
ncbi:6-phosphogluconolactonase [Oricola indica]|uniref:6-phosphogluconolactonase n=1 Tax=Oricola indica TaxID=2872591 RepID=UPI003CCC31B6